MKKIITLLLAFVLLVSSLSLSTFAQTDSLNEIEGSNIIAPLWANGNDVSLTFAILSNGVAYVNVNYFGVNGVTTQVSSKAYIQKRMFGFIWVKVDIGENNDEWLDIDTENYFGTFSHSAQMSSTGTYRAVFEVTFSGTGGEDDVISAKIQAVY